MSEETRVVDLVTMLRAASEVWTPQVLSVLEKSDSAAAVGRTIAQATELHRTYSVRLAAQRDGAGPDVENLAAFVQALEAPGGAARGGKRFGQVHCADPRGRCTLIRRGEGPTMTLVAVR